VLLVATLAAGSLVALGHGAEISFANVRLTAIDPAFTLLWMLGVACAIVAAQQAKFHRFVAVVLMSGAGFVSCITFLWLSAPDLALTQLLVEVVTTVLLLLGLRWLPKRLEERRDFTPASVFRARLRRGLDLSIAIAAGLATTVLAFSVMTAPMPETISHYFIEKSYSEAGGRNVVNVLLVDFRAFDTLGEITVLGVVGLTVFALLRRFRPAAESLASPEQQIAQRAFEQHSTTRTTGAILADYLMIPRVVMQWLFPAIAVFAIYLFLRGHDLPGGGFIAGVTMSIAFIIQYMASGT
jgi:multicomponent K+:H+ antiporter subunit A